MPTIVNHLDKGTLHKYFDYDLDDIAVNAIVPLF